MTYRRNATTRTHYSELFEPGAWPYVAAEHLMIVLELSRPGRCILAQTAKDRANKDFAGNARNTGAKSRERRKMSGHSI